MALLFRVDSVDDAVALELAARGIREFVNGKMVFIASAGPRRRDSTE